MNTHEEGRPAGKHERPPVQYRTSHTVPPRTASVTAHRRWNHRPTFSAIACDVIVWAAWVGIAVAVIAAVCLSLYLAAAVVAR